MRKLTFLLLTLLLALRAAPALGADPLTGRGGAPAVTSTMTATSSVVLRFAALQHHLNDEISTAFREVRDGPSGGVWFVILGLAFLYGALHAIGPGHGKTVVASYFVGRRARWTSGVLMGSIISLIQGASAVALVGVLALLLQWQQLDILSRSTLVEFVCYGLIALLGAVMFYRAVTGRGCVQVSGDGQHHSEGHHDHGHAVAALDPKLVLATGLTPCASAIILLLFALANDSLGVGVAAVCALSIGMAITVSTIGAASVLGRRALLRVVEGVGMTSHRIEQGLAVVGALAIMSASGLMVLDAWFRL